MQRRRRRTRKCVEAEDSKGASSGAIAQGTDEVQEVARTDVGRIDSRKFKRECPVPKPGGLVGEILGFRGSSNGKPEGEGGGGARPP